MMTKRLQHFLDTYAKLVYNENDGQVYTIRSRPPRQQRYVAVAPDGLIEGFGRTLEEAKEFLT